MAAASATAPGGGRQRGAVHVDAQPEQLRPARRPAQERLAAAAAEVERVGCSPGPSATRGSSSTERPSLGAGQPPGTGVEGAHGPAARRPRLLGGHAASVGPARGRKPDPGVGRRRASAGGPVASGACPASTSRSRCCCRSRRPATSTCCGPPSAPATSSGSRPTSRSFHRAACGPATFPAALAVLRAAAAASRPLTLVLGPVATFSPVTPTVHLAVERCGRRRRRRS